MAEQTRSKIVVSTSLDFEDESAKTAFQIQKGLDIISFWLGTRKINKSQHLFSNATITSAIFDEDIERVGNPFKLNFKKKSIVTWYVEAFKVQKTLLYLLPCLHY